MDIVNPDLSHLAFLEQANIDIQSAKILLESKQYSNAVYLFQQSVEKSCKYIGLTIKSFDHEKLRQISHEPKKVFDKIFHNEIFKSIDGNKNYDTLKELFFDLDFEKRANVVLKCIKEFFNKTSSNTNSYSKQLIDYYNKSPFKNYLPADFVEIVTKCKEIPEAEDICMKYLYLAKNAEFCMLCQMLMSFLVSGIEANSRYPDYSQNTIPRDLYSDQTDIVKYLPYFIEKQEFCIAVLHNCF